MSSHVSQDRQLFGTGMPRTQTYKLRIAIDKAKICSCLFVQSRFRPAMRMNLEQLNSLVGGGGGGGVGGGGEAEMARW